MGVYQKGRNKGVNMMLIYHLQQIRPMPMNHVIQIKINQLLSGHLTFDEVLTNCALLEYLNMSSLAQRRTLVIPDLPAVTSGSEW
jgi:hypothetical protein